MQKKHFIFNWRDHKIEGKIVFDNFQYYNEYIFSRHVAQLYDYDSHVDIKCLTFLPTMFCFQNPELFFLICQTGSIKLIIMMILILDRLLFLKCLSGNFSNTLNLIAMR